MFAYDDFMTFDTFYNKILQETTILEFPSQKYKQVNSSFFFLVTIFVNYIESFEQFLPI